MVRLEGRGVGGAEGGGQFVGWVRGVVAQGLGCEVEAAGSLRVSKGYVGGRRVARKEAEGVRKARRERW